MKMKFLTTLGLSALSVALSSAVYAGKPANKGPNPNGKPFIEIQGQLIEIEGELSTVQDQVDDLVGRVESLEEDVLAHESAISELETLNIELRRLIDVNLGDIDIMKGQILDLQAANVELLHLMALGDSTLQAQITTNERLITALQFAVSDIGPLQAQIDALVEINENATDQADIDANHYLIANLQDQISGLDGLQSQINNNSMLIGTMQGALEDLRIEVDKKQNIIAGNCPDGSGIVQVFANGSIECDSAGSGGGATGQLYAYSRYNWGYVPPGMTDSLYAYCDDYNDIPTSVTFYIGKLNIRDTYVSQPYVFPDFRNQGYGAIAATFGATTNDYNGYFEMRVHCLSIPGTGLEPS